MSVRIRLNYYPPGPVRYELKVECEWCSLRSIRNGCLLCRDQRNELEDLHTNEHFQGLYAALQSKPTDFLRANVLADWLDDRGKHDLATQFRECAKVFDTWWGNLSKPKSACQVHMIEIHRQWNAPVYSFEDV